jgi:hypothetical protein
MNTFKIEFEILAKDRVRVFLNDQRAGNVRLHEVTVNKKPVLRLTYRGNSPFKNLIKTESYLDLTLYSVEQLLAQGNVYNQIVAVAIRNYLYSYGARDLPLRQAA